MNILTKLFLAALAVATLAGCGYTPVQAPKTEAERIETKSLLNVPVDVSTFKTHKLNIVAENGDKGRITVFTDPKTGKTYDLDGQPVNEKGERILANGKTCNPGAIVNNMRGYGTSLNMRYECWTSAAFAFVNNDETAVKAYGKAWSGAVGAAAAVNPVTAVGIVVGPMIGVMLKDHEMTDDMPDTM